MATKAKRKAKRAGSKSGAPPVVARRRSQFAGDDDEDGAPLAKHWRHEVSSSDCAESLWTWCDRLRAYSAQDGLEDLIHEAMYRGRPHGSGRNYGARFLALRDGRLLNLNIIMSMVDTATARLARKRSMPCISANDANYTEKFFAQEVSGILRRKMSPRLVRDMIIRGTGCVLTERIEGDTYNKRIPIYELVYDPFEAETGEMPRQLAHVRPEPRDVMMARYPRFAKEIAGAPRYSYTDAWSSYAYRTVSQHDYIEVRTAWYLPTSPTSADGQAVTTIRGCVIDRRVWRRPRFPVAMASWSPPTRGWGRGEGLVSTLSPIQERINKILADASEGLDNGSQLVVFVQRGANVDKHHLRARHPKLVEHDGAAPQYVAPNPVSEQAIRILLMLIEQAYQITGISQMAAQSKNTLGKGTSGKAIDAMDDLQSDRFAHVEADYQQTRVEIGQHNVDEGREMYMEAFDKLPTDEQWFDEQLDPPSQDELAPWIKDADWSEVDIDSGNYHLTLEPVNYLSDSRSGRLEQAAELGANGLIPDPSMQADLFQEPDIQRMNRVILGPKHKLDRIMQGLANPKVDLFDLQPDQYTNLELGVLMAKGELNEAESTRDPLKPDERLEEVCERYRKWIELAKNQIKLAQSGSTVPSLPGMMANNMGAAPNAATLQPGLGAPPPPIAPGIGDPGMALPPGMAA